MTSISCVHSSGRFCANKILLGGAVRSGLGTGLAFCVAARFGAELGAGCGRLRFSRGLNVPFALAAASLSSLANWMLIGRS
eukprot:CAMPEP_0196780534 /NCGR_PEP_ID=MMETSP1104-20130614/7948_1 /TAXON_ID=33652 /ORGANISM="Cafeteria sp., Strain Caron Lab Isolate" /LENGTH=80 /DNA_ID=CAMNT_0042150745 /DNA_START=227 /DNA_END=469 /DNA_ORIENTATION=+